MFDKTATYRKSGAGAEALASRSAALTPRLRSLLILVDGKRRCDELAGLGQAFGDGEQLLAQLAELGFIEPLQAPAASGGPTGAGPAVAAAPAPAKVPLAQAQRQAVRKLNDLLGPAAEDLCLRIEATRNPQEFAAAIARAEGTLRQFASPQVAQQFAAEMESLRPA